jgi:transposase
MVILYYTICVLNAQQLTLEELCELLHEKIGVTISRATMGRMTQRLKMA